MARASPQTWSLSSRLPTALSFPRRRPIARALRVYLSAAMLSTRRPRRRYRWRLRDPGMCVHFIFTRICSCPNLKKGVLGVRSLPLRFIHIHRQPSFIFTALFLHPSSFLFHLFHLASFSRIPTGTVLVPIEQPFSLCSFFLPCLGFGIYLT